MTFDTGKKILGGAVIGGDGTIYFGSDDKTFYALNPDGTTKWTFDVTKKIQSTPLVGPDGAVYFGANDKTLYALNPDGALRWSYELPRKVKLQASMASDGTLYVSTDGVLTALNANGSLKWIFDAGHKLDTIPVLADDGTVYFGAGKILYAVNPDGTQKWVYNAGKEIEVAPAVLADGSLAVIADKQVMKVSSSGVTSAVLTFATRLRGRLLVDSADHVIVSTTSGELAMVAASTWQLLLSLVIDDLKDPKGGCDELPGPFALVCKAGELLIAITAAECLGGKTNEERCAWEKRECGENRCHGECDASCGESQVCVSGKCQACTPDCGSGAARRVCGDDGCGCSCGVCTLASTCTAAGQCELKPDCANHPWTCEREGFAENVDLPDENDVCWVTDPNDVVLPPITEYTPIECCDPVLSPIAGVCLPGYPGFPGLTLDIPIPCLQARLDHLFEQISDPTAAPEGTFRRCAEDPAKGRWVRFASTSTGCDITLNFNVQVASGKVIDGRCDNAADEDGMVTLRTNGLLTYKIGGFRAVCEQGGAEVPPDPETGRCRAKERSFPNATLAPNWTGSSDVVVANMFFQDATGHKAALPLPEERDPLLADAIMILGGGSNIWIHRNTFSGQGTNGQIDATVIRPTDPVSNITVSWNRFQDHHEVMSIGGGDGDTEAERYHLTLHHNLYQNTGTRHPIARFAKIHSYNNHQQYWQKYTELIGQHSGGDQGEGIILGRLSQFRSMANLYSPGQECNVICDGTVLCPGQCQWAQVNLVNEDGTPMPENKCGSLRSVGDVVRPGGVFLAPSEGRCTTEVTFDKALTGSPLDPTECNVPHGGFEDDFCYDNDSSITSPISHEDKPSTLNYAGQMLETRLAKCTGKPLEGDASCN